MCWHHLFQSLNLKQNMLKLFKIKIPISSAELVCIVTQRCGFKRDRREGRSTFKVATSSSFFHLFIVNANSPFVSQEC